MFGFCEHFAEWPFSNSFGHSAFSRESRLPFQSFDKDQQIIREQAVDKSPRRRAQPPNSVRERTAHAGRLTPLFPRPKGMRPRLGQEQDVFDLFVNSLEVEPKSCF